MASTIDPATLEPSPGAQLLANVPDLQWRDIVAFSDVLDVTVTPPREPEPGDAPVDLFVFAAVSLSSDHGGPAELSIGFAHDQGYGADRRARADAFTHPARRRRCECCDKTVGS